MDVRDARISSGDERISSLHQRPFRKSRHHRGAFGSGGATAGGAPLRGRRPAMPGGAVAAGAERPRSGRLTVGLGDRSTSRGEGRERGAHRHRAGCEVGHRAGRAGHRVRREGWRRAARGRGGSPSEPAPSGRASGATPSARSDVTGGARAPHPDRRRCRRGRRRRCPAHFPQ